MAMPPELVAELGPVASTLVVVGGYLHEKYRGSMKQVQDSQERIEKKQGAMAVVVRAISSQTNGVDAEKVDELLIDNGLEPGDVLKDRSDFPDEPHLGRKDGEAPGRDPGAR